MGLRNVSAKKITIAAKAVICLVQLADMVPKLCFSDHMSTEANQEEDESWILVKLDIGGQHQWTEEQQQAAMDLLCKSADTFSKNAVF